MKQKHTLYEENAEILNLKAGGAYTNHCFFSVIKTYTS